MVGQRIVRSVIAVALSFVIYTLRGNDGIPFYTALAVLQCIQPYQESMFKVAKKRTIGTFVGAFWGMIILMIEMYGFNGRLEDTLPSYLLISLFTGLVLYFTVVLKVKETSYFSCVVFLSIVAMHMGDAHPVLFVLDRVIDTLIGVCVALIINSVHLPRRRNNDVLYVSGIDDTILDKESHLAPYSKIELNRMIREGLQFTVSTIRTPASVRETMNEIHFNMPIIAMDDAVLYDMKENAYLMKYQMSKQEASRITNFIAQYNMQVFVNTVVDNLLVIYYHILDNEAQQRIYTARRQSPYRNYVHSNKTVVDNVVYLLLIDKTDKIEIFYEDLMKQEWIRDFRIEKNPSFNYPGYTYIKIYHKNATRENMLKNLKALKNIDKSLTFGSLEGRYDILITDSGKDHMVKQLKRLYKPVSIKGARYILKN